MDHEKDHDKDHEKYHDMDHDKDHEKDHGGDQGMMCHKDNNQGKCKSLGKKIDEGMHCFRYGDNKCASSHCCKEHDDDKDHGKDREKDHDDTMIKIMMVTRR
ncbi:hypothetical protein SARC_09455 [Sphaeroforma arctica JP610]|uniref:Uncharacterized protein n=1 Tax=Sphaeroforma arctica JP610 TaxID=667725 RepID=A0A0L0FMY8_9EUKA|nr:hypothetical protein SARC_09455 [Sphaeroforma arctica JP610]KNC78104.1 hypothetical protein SARC_09455 [Sphaeroforma arctica JP610]|eukprot:XP_014152006.1 hypothetical protein SARC_09455 [Sphaeroforma arctica JP610]